MIPDIEFYKTILELFGAFVVTFLGVYISINYTKKSDREKEERERKKIYVGSLILLVSELNLNMQPLIPLGRALDNIPDEPGKYYDNYGFLLEMAKGIKTDVFYGLISSGSMNEIIISGNIFNKIQQACYNTQKTINGISLSREVFKDFANKSIDVVPQALIIESKRIISVESEKIKRTIKMVEDAQKEIERELIKYGMSFTENMNYTGVIIEESLGDKSILKSVRIVKTKVEPIKPSHKTPWLKQWTLHTVEIPEKQAEQIAQKISESFDPKHPNWYTDYKNDKYHFIIFAGKVFKVDLQNPSLCKEAKTYGVSIGIPEYQLDFAPEDKVWDR